MGNKNNIIELNGKKYDAVTGTLVHDGAAHAKPITDFVKKPTASQAKAVHHVTKKDPVRTPKPHTSTKQVMDVIRPAQQHVKAHHPEHSKTLMRHAVKKPTDSFKRQTKIQTRTDILAKVPSLQVLPKLSISQVDAARLKRAERIAKSRLISRFAPIQPVRYQVAAATATAPTVSVSIPTTPAPVSRATRPSMDIFERALVHATAHQEPTRHRKDHPKAKRHRARTDHRVLSTTAAVVALLLIAGFIGYQNKANLTMRVATAHAGFHATLPGYKPSGFAMGKFSYSPGIVAVNFHSNTDNRSFNVIQKASNWDSETLLDNYVATASEQYQAFQANGETIYIYGNNNATWVNNGIWYRVTDNGSLSTNQVLQLAQSM